MSTERSTSPKGKTMASRSILFLISFVIFAIVVSDLLQETSAQNGTYIIILPATPLPILASNPNVFQALQQFLQDL